MINRVYVDRWPTCAETVNDFSSHRTRIRFSFRYAVFVFLSPELDDMYAKTFENKVPKHNAWKLKKNII